MHLIWVTIFVFSMAAAAGIIAYSISNRINEKKHTYDFQADENIKRANTLAVPLAFSFAASAKKTTHSQVDLIKKWANNTDIPVTGKWKLHKLNLWLTKPLQNHRHNRNRNLCRNIASQAPLSVRYNLLALCMKVIEAGGNVCDEQIELLKNTSQWFDVRLERLRSMLEDIHPFNMQQVNDIELSLGITADMTDEQTRRQLSAEYRKWNSRVINSDPNIRAEAKHMLEIIGEAKALL